MVVPNREIANSNISTYTLAMSYPVESKVNSEDIQIRAPILEMKMIDFNFILFYFSFLFSFELFHIFYF